MRPFSASKVHAILCRATGKEQSSGSPEAAASLLRCQGRAAAETLLAVTAGNTAGWVWPGPAKTINCASMWGRLGQSRENIPPYLTSPVLLCSRRKDEWENMPEGGADLQGRPDNKGDSPARKHDLPPSRIASSRADTSAPSTSPTPLCGVFDTLALIVRATVFQRKALNAAGQILSSAERLSFPIDFNRRCGWSVPLGGRSLA